MLITDDESRRCFATAQERIKEFNERQLHYRFMDLKGELAVAKCLNADPDNPFDIEQVFSTHVGDRRRIGLSWRKRRFEVRTCDRRGYNYMVWGGRFKADVGILVWPMDSHKDKGTLRVGHMAIMGWAKKEDIQKGKRTGRHLSYDFHKMKHMSTMNVPINWWPL